MGELSTLWIGMVVGWVLGTAATLIVIGVILGVTKDRSW